MKIAEYSRKELKKSVKFFLDESMAIMIHITQFFLLKMEKRDKVVNRRKYLWRKLENNFSIFSIIINIRESEQFKL